MNIQLPFPRTRREAVRGSTPRLRAPRYWPALLLGTIAVLLTGFGIWRVAARSSTATPPPTASVTQGDMAITVEGSGAVQPARSVDLPFQTTGQVKEVLVKAGDQVKTGQPLARLDSRDLQLQVQTAEANLKTAQAKLDVAEHGSATPQDLAQGKAQIQAAEAALEKARTGNTTPADIANAQAGLAAAQDRLHQTKTGNSTSADIAAGQASLRNAEANLQKVRTGNTTPADIANAQAAVRSAQAKLDAAKAGPSAADVSSAQSKLKQAQASAEKLSVSDAAAKTTAQQNVTQAQDNLQLAQQAYNTAVSDNQQAQAGIDPKTNKSFTDEKLDPATQQQQYANALQQAKLQVDLAQSKLTQAQATYDSAKQQAVTDAATAQAQVDDAQVQLNQLLAGPKTTDLIPLQAAVDQAKAQLTKLQQGPTAADLAAAQAQVDQAKANLAKLEQGGTASDIAIANDSVTQAQAQLDKARQGGTPADIASAQAQLEQTRASVEKLTAPAAEPDIATAQAGVAQAEAQLETAKLNLDRATLFAPFDATIGTVNIVPGSIVGANTAAATLVDRSSLHVDINMSETDVAQVQTGQPVQLTFDALPGAVASGIVQTIAPTSTVQQNVVTYLVQVGFNPGATPIKLGMTANANITVQQITNAILVPSRAIQTQGQDHTVQVLYGTGQLPVPVHVDTGATNGTLTEITSCTDTGSQCLHDGDRLVLPTSTTSTRSSTGAGAGAGLLGGARGGGGGGFLGGAGR